MSRDILNDIINEFEPEKFIRFFRAKNSSFSPRREGLTQYNDDNFKGGHKIGDIKFQDNSLIICTFQVLQPLSEKSGKRLQYEKGKMILKETQSDAGIFIFYDEKGNFRFSLIYANYLGRRRDWSTFRRFTYFVSKDFTNKTFLQRIGGGDFTNLDKIKDAFSVEKVTEEFYLEYRKLFEDLVKDLNKNFTFKNEAQKNNIDTENFAKKLLGQIVFIYFLQKKGWLGVPAGEKWGKGDQSFLINLFREAIDQEKNFYNDYLEKLFYDTLNNSERGTTDPSFSKTFNCRIPFLNGGLFEPEYNWKNSFIYLDNAIFRSILETFDRYNFTVEEESPDDKEVAIDPEMLGKVFENLLPENLRKGKGTYYTPREIVHYMCQESLVYFLMTETKIEESLIRKLVGHYEVEPLGAEDIRLYESNKELALKKASVKPVTYWKADADKIISALSNIKIIDPACGSGAFLIGMLQKIVKLRKLLEEKRTEYDLKKETIQNCIYGVDIDPGAVEIAKLRLWLSLVVEYEVEDIEPLPNLDYKIMVGNSLIELLSPVLLAITTDHERNKFIKELNELKDKYFLISDSNEKRQVREQINSLIHLLVNYDNKKERENIWSQILSYRNQTKLFADETGQVSFGDVEEQNLHKKLQKLDKLKDVSATDHFEWHLNFNEIFDGGGFDVVIGNPPYLRIQGIQKVDPELAQKYKKLYKSATGAFDLYVLFLERGLVLLDHKGILNFILPHKWVNSAFGIGIRKIIHNNGSGKKMISFGAHQVFNASNYTSLLWLSKSYNDNFEYFEFSRDLVNNRELEDALNKLTPNDYNFIANKSLDENPWILTDSKIGKILKKLSEQPLRVKDIFIKIFQGIATSDDKVFVLTYRQERTNTAILFSKALNKEVEIEKALLKPFLMGKDVHRYKKLYTTNRIIFPYILINGAYQLMNTDYFSKNYPLGWKYLTKNQERLKRREHGIFKDTWWCFSRPQNMDFFEKEKIITPEISNGSNMTIDFEGSFFHTTKCYSLLKKESVNEDYRFFLGILNSRLLWFFLENTGYILRGGYFTFKTNYLEPFPLPEVDSSKEQDQIVKLVDEIYSLSNSSNNDHKTSENIQKLEYQIDEIVYKLYGLTPEEIAVVEGKNELKI